MAEPEGLHCCGITELTNIRDGSAEDSLMAVDPTDQAFILFTEVQEDGHESCNKGRKLAALIRKHKLGTVMTMPLTVNPNTDNRIKPYLWKVCGRRLAAWQNRQDSNEDREMVDPFYNPWRH